MATLRTEGSSAPGIFNPRSPWFWLVSGLGTFVLAVIVIVVLTQTGVLARNDIPQTPPAVRQKPNAEATPPRDLEVPPAERKRALRTKLEQVTAQQKELERDRQKIEAALAAARAGGENSAEVGRLRARLSEANGLWRTLETEREDLVATLEKL